MISFVCCSGPVWVRVHRVAKHLCWLIVWTEKKLTLVYPFLSCTEESRLYSLGFPGRSQENSRHMRVVTAATWDNTVLHTDCEKQRLRLLAAAATRDRDRLHFFVFFFPKESVGGKRTKVWACKQRTSFAGLRRRCSGQSVPTSQGLSSTVGGTCRARGGHLPWCLTQRREAGRGPRPRPEWSRPRAPGAVLLIVVSEPHVERGLCAG